MQNAEVIDLENDQEDITPADLRSRVKAEMAEYRLTQAEVSKEAGLSRNNSGSKLNQWLQGKYTGDNSTIEAALERWLLYRAEKRQIATAMPAAPHWYETNVSKRVLNALRYAQMAGDLVAIYGGAGLGKSKSALHHAANNPNVWVATMSPSSGSVGGFQRRVCRALGMSTNISRSDDLEDAIIERLNDTGGLLILDEAQHLNHRALHSVQRLQDASEVGIALMGNEIIYTRLTGGRRSAEFAQLFSRIGKRVKLNKPSIGDIRSLMDAWGLTGADELALLTELGKRPGALRGITKTLRLAAMFAGGHTVTVNHMRAAWKDLGGEL